MKLRIALFIGLIPFVASARSYDTSRLPYSDAPTDLETAVAVSALTEAGVLEGNPDGTLRPDMPLNRAEFMTIAMRLLSTDDVPFFVNCFVDVPADAWYAKTVCQAKEMGIVSGNAIAGVSEVQWPFEPARSVRYEEVLKVLVGLYAIPHADLQGEEWYEQYVRAAVNRSLALSELRPGQAITRGQMARLVASFLAWSEGELLHLRTAQGVKEDAALSLCEPHVCSDGTTHRSCTEDGHPISYFVDPCFIANQTDASDAVEQNQDDTDSDVEIIEDDDAVYDPYTDDSTRSDFILLGSVSSVLGAANVFSDLQPFDFTQIQVIFTGSVDSISSVLIYDHDRKLIGRAFRDSSLGNSHYALNLKHGTVVIGKREEYTFYVRAQMKEHDAGGQSGETVELSNLKVVGDGVWNHKQMTKSTTDDFSAFQTARSTMTNISNGGSDQDVLVSGNDIPLGSFLFEGVTGDTSADLEVTSLEMRVEENGGVTVSNVTLGADNTSDRHGCSVVSGVFVTCSSIPAQFGSMEDIPRTLTLYGDVSVSDDEERAWIRLKINQAGSVLSAGDVTWTDGDTVFTWVPGNNPVATSTWYKR